MIRIDLFALHDKKQDDALRKCIMASGAGLRQALARIIADRDKTQLVKFFEKRLNISITSAERLVYLKKEWYPLVFIEELLAVTGNTAEKYKIQDRIDFLKANHPPMRVIKAVKFLSLPLCKIAGAHAADGTMAVDWLIRITDYYKDNIAAFAEWTKEVFGRNFPVKRKESSSSEYLVEFKSKVIARYFSHVLGFSIGLKQYTVREPTIIKRAQLEYRKAFVLGALTFEAGVGIRNAVELCVVSKDFRDDVSEILTLAGVNHCKMQKVSSTYWRLWSKSLSGSDASTWMEFFESDTEKWKKLKDARDGFVRRVSSHAEALQILNEVYPSKPASKVSINNILEVIKNRKRTFRYEICADLCRKNNLASYGGKWAHSLLHYIQLLERANIISVSRKKFGKKKSFGSIVRQVYTYNPDVSSWMLPS